MSVEGQLITAPTKLGEQQLVERKESFNHRNKITICVRLRPTIQEDFRNANAVRNAPEICVHLKSDGQTVKLIQDRFHSRLYKVDHTFGVNSSQTEVYNIGLKPVVSDVLRGYNGTGIVYGQPSSGKTYTMFGNENKLGIAHFAISDIFDRIHQYEENSLIGKVFMSFYHIHVEQIYDLLSEAPANPKQPLTALNIREDNVRGVHVENLSTYHVKDKATAHALIAEGSYKRKVHASTQNIKASRSHAILQIFVDLEETNLFPSHNGVNKVKSSESDNTPNTSPESQKFIVRRRKLILVDLAGTERVSSHRYTSKQQLKESAIINKSIAALGNCISVLCNSSDLGHVPFRDTKLTRLLAESLGGHSKTCIIANISPCAYHYEETYSTLKFATRAKSVNRNLKQPNDLPFDTQLLTYVQKRASPTNLNSNYDDEDPDYIDNNNNQNNNSNNMSHPGYYQTVLPVNLSDQPLLPPELHHYQQNNQSQQYPEGYFSSREGRPGPTTKQLQSHYSNESLLADNNNNELHSQESIGDNTRQYGYDPAQPPLQVRKNMVLSSHQGGTGKPPPAPFPMIGSATGGNGSFSLQEFLKACTTNQFTTPNSHHKGGGDGGSSNTSDIDDSTIQDDYYESEFHSHQHPSSLLAKSKESLAAYDPQPLPSLHSKSVGTQLNSSQPQPGGGFASISRSSSFQEHLRQEHRNPKTKNGIGVQELNIAVGNLNLASGESFDSFDLRVTEQLPPPAPQIGGQSPRQALQRKQLLDKQRFTDSGMVSGGGSSAEEMSRFLSSDEFSFALTPSAPPTATMDALIMTTRKTFPPTPTSPSNVGLPPLPTSPRASRATAASSDKSSGIIQYSNTSAASSMVDIKAMSFEHPVTKKIMVDKAIQSNKLVHTRSSMKYDGSLNDFAPFTTFTQEKDTEMDYDLLIQMNNPGVGLEYFNEEDLALMRKSFQNPLLLYKEVLDLRKQVLERDEEIERLKKFILDQV